MVCRRQWKELPLTEEIIDKVNIKGRSDAGLKPDKEIPEQFVFKYMDGTLVAVEDETDHTDNQRGNNITTSNPHKQNTHD